MVTFLKHKNVDIDIRGFKICINWKLLYFVGLRDLNALNIPTHDRQHQLKTQELVSQAASLVRELVQGLSNFHTYCEQRSSTYPADKDRETLSVTNKKVSTPQVIMLLLNNH